MQFHGDKDLNKYLKKYASFYIAGIFIFLCVCYSKAIYGALIFFALGLWVIIYCNLKIKKLFKYFQEMSTVDQSCKYCNNVDRKINYYLFNKIGLVKSIFFKIFFFINFIFNCIIIYN